MKNSILIIKNFEPDTIRHFKKIVSNNHKYPEMQEVS